MFLEAKRPSRIDIDGRHLEPDDLLVLHAKGPALPSAKVSRYVYGLELTMCGIQKRLWLQRALDGHEA
jgi:hypothetical protein